MKCTYKQWNPGEVQRSIIAQADEICLDYQEQGYDLTLRQLYYQFVARGLLPNDNRSYHNLGTTISNARLAGMLDWDFIVDRTRNLQSLSHWATPADIIEACATQYMVDKWTTQPRRIEVWVEKEALAGVIGQAAEEWDVSYFACRGYVSQSELWAAGRRIFKYIEGGQPVTILHLGDHDPSGIDMTRDIADRLTLFIGTDYSRKYAEELPGGSLEVKRIALNWEQVQHYNPPPNPTKLTDSRAKGYIREYGMESWELDALDPATLDELITDEIRSVVDEEAYEKRGTVQAAGRKQLLLVSRNLKKEKEEKHD